MSVPVTNSIVGGVVSLLQDDNEVITANKTMANKDVILFMGFWFFL